MIWTSHLIGKNIGSNPKAHPRFSALMNGEAEVGIEIYDSQSELPLH